MLLSSRLLRALVFTWLMFAPDPALFAQLETTGEISGTLRRWHKVTLTFDGPETSEVAVPNPFLDYRLNVTFTNGNQTFVVPGYYAADGNAAETSGNAGNKWRVHFTPNLTGTWTYTASFRTGANVALSLAAGAGTPTHFDGETGTFVVEETDKVAPDFRGRGMLEYVGDHHLQFAWDGTYYLKNGANSPENLLAYADFDSTYDTGGVMEDFIHEYAPHAADWQEGDPTWKDGKGKNLIGALNYLSSQNINSVYFLTYTLDGGDGMDVWMWTTPEERLRFDVSKLDQWEIVFKHMDKLGIQLHIVTQEMENDELLGGSSGMNDVRKLYYRELVARYGHHLAVVWNLGEENENSDTERIAFAEYIRALDPYDHPITVHTGYNASDGFYNDLVGNPNFDATSIQGDGIRYNEWTIELREKSAEAGRKWAIYGDEQGPAVLKDMSNIRQIMSESQWGNLMGGGAGAEWYFGYQNEFGDLQSEDWRMAEPLWTLSNHAIEFFQEQVVDFPFMEPANELVNEGALALALSGELFVVYLPVGTSLFEPTLDLQFNSLTYSVQWFDPINGGALQTGTVPFITAPGVQLLGLPPHNPDQEWAILIKPFDPNATPTPGITETPVATVVPGTNHLQNPDFELSGLTEQHAHQWTTKPFSKAKRVCNKPEKVVAHTGDCAFRLNALPGGNSQIVQKTTIPFGVIGEALTLSAWVKGKKLPGEVQLKAKVKYQDGTKASLLVNLNSGTYDYADTSNSINLSGAVERVVVKFGIKAEAGKYWIDQVQLVHGVSNSPIGLNG